MELSSKIHWLPASQVRIQAVCLWGGGGGGCFTINGGLPDVLVLVLEAVWLEWLIHMGVFITIKADTLTSPSHHQTTPFDYIVVSTV